jgi:hypothetical protein
MQQNQQTQPQPPKPQPPKPQPVSRPNERGAIALSGFLKISDPETKQVFVETRA